MDFDLNDDQATVLNAIAPLLNRHRRLRIRRRRSAISTATRWRQI